MRNLKWYHLVAIGLGLAAVVAIVWIVLNFDIVRDRLPGKQAEALEA